MALERGRIPSTSLAYHKVRPLGAWPTSWLGSPDRRSTTATVDFRSVPPWAIAKKYHPASLDRLCPIPKEGHQRALGGTRSACTSAYSYQWDIERYLSRTPEHSNPPWLRTGAQHGRRQVLYNVRIPLPHVPWLVGHILGHFANRWRH